MRPHCSTSLPKISSACRRRARRPSASTLVQERLFALSSPIAPRPDGSGSRRSSRPTSSERTPWTRPGSPMGRAPAWKSSEARMRRRSRDLRSPTAMSPLGGWRNTPYVVIQNVGAYLDVPRFLDSDHQIENAADAEAYLARLQSYAKAARRRAWPHAGRARDGLGAARLSDRHGAGGK